MTGDGGRPARTAAAAGPAGTPGHAAGVRYPAHENLAAGQVIIASEGVIFQPGEERPHAVTFQRPPLCAKLPHVHVKRS